MTIIIFIIIILVLVMIHEAGHFLAAKVSGVRVDEFAFGFPPKLFSKKIGETNYVWNSLPIGGYVKIHGENGDGEMDTRSFVYKNVFIKIFILSAGVLMNLFLAYILIIFSTYLSANITVLENDIQYQKYLSDNRILEKKTLITNVLNNSPAEKVGLKAGNQILELFLNQENSSGRILNQTKIDLMNLNGEQLAKNISFNINNSDINKNFESITLVYKNENEILRKTIAGVYGFSSENKKVLGLVFIQTANVNLTVWESLKTGIQKTNSYIYLTIIGFKDLFVNFFSQGEISKDITGPVGIVALVSSAKTMGFSYLLIFTAILSISLGIFNILPFPALDGGRIFLVIVESIMRKKISHKWQMILNGSGFTILILLMILVTIKDILNFLK